MWILVILKIVKAYDSHSLRSQSITLWIYMYLCHDNIYIIVYSEIRIGVVFFQTFGKNNWFLWKSKISDILTN